MDTKTRIITVATFTFLGIYSITCGALYPKYQEAKTPKTSFLLVQQKQVGIKEEVTLKLKEITTEVNLPLSVKIVDYLEEPVASEILAKLKLDTSTVNVQQPGEYKYTVYYKKKSFEGKVIVKEKEIQKQEIKPPITIRANLEIKLGETIPSDPTFYIIEPITEEMRSKIRLDITEIRNDQPGEYRFFIYYENAYQQGTIRVVEEKPPLSPVPTHPTEEQNPNQQTENSNDGTNPNPQPTE